MSVDGASVAERDTAAYAPRWTASIACGGAIGDVDAQIHRTAPRGGAGGLARFVARTRGREATVASLRSISNRASFRARANARDGGTPSHVMRLGISYSNNVCPLIKSFNA